MRSKLNRVNPGQPSYEGCYFRTSRCHGKVYYIKYTKGGKQHLKKIGTSRDTLPEQVRLEREAALNGYSISPAEDICSVEMSKLTMDEAFEKYLDFVRLKPTSKQSRVSRYKNHIQPYLGNTNLKNITPQRIEQLRKFWDKCGIKPQTQEQVRILISSIYNTMIKKMEYFGSNPAVQVEKIGDPVRRERILSQEETTELLLELNNENFHTYLIAAMAVYTGMRLDEIRRMTPRSIDFKRGIISIKNAKSRGKVKTRYVYFKGDPAIKGILESIESEFSDNIAAPDKPYFSYPGGGFNRRSYDRAINKMGLNDHVEAGDQENRVVFHTLRHSYAAAFLAAGGTLPELQEALGHDSSRSTEIYRHMANDTAQNAQKRLAEYRASNSKSWLS